jgi:kynurenine 3-monooxygenase
MRGDHSFATLTGSAELLAFMRTWFPDVADRIPDLSGQFFDQRANSMLTIRCEPWSSGRVLLIGDAAHAILPFYGQGANAGFEDCAVLDRCLEEQTDWDAVFFEFERVRRPNMDVMADLCVDHFVELSERLGDSRVLLRHEVERRLEQLDPNRFAPLYSNVAFTSTPYAEAAALERRQRALIDRVLALPGMETQMVTSIVDRCAREAA